MTAEKVFLANGQVRPIWRFFLSTPMVVFAMLAAQKTAEFVAAPDLLAGWARPVGSTLLMLPALLAAFKFLTLVFDRKPLASVGLTFRGRWAAELGHGAAVGSVMILGVAAAQAALGMARFSWNAAAPAHLAEWGGATLAVLFVAAVNEEFTFRGYPFQRLVESLGAPAAVAVLSVLFGVVHLGNPNRTVISTLNTMLVGIPFAVSYLRTRALWMPVGMHFAWNFVQGVGLGLPVSGIAVPISLFRAEVSGNTLMTGGAYGPEASILTTIAVIVATGYLGRAKSIYTSEAMRELVWGSERAETGARGTFLKLETSPGPANADRPTPEP